MKKVRDLFLSLVYLTVTIVGMMISLFFFFSAFFLLSYFLYTSVVLHVYLPYAYCIVTNLFLCTWAYMCRFFDPKTLIASWAVEIGAEESSSRCSVFAWSSIRCPELLCCNLVQTINPPWFYLSMIKYFQALWKHSLNDVISNFCSVFIWLTLNHAVRVPRRNSTLLEPARFLTIVTCKLFSP